MKAVLVDVQLTTRLIVADDETEDSIIEKAVYRLIQKIESGEWTESMQITDDVECPYDPEFDI